jgi:hypothetical protein
MPLGRYRITEPTIAVVEEEGRHVSYTVPIGAVVSADMNSLQRNGLVDVVWSEKPVMMFAQDLRSRSRPLNEDG